MMSWDCLVLIELMRYLHISDADKTDEKRETPSFWRALFRAHGFEILVPGFLLFVGQLTQFINPFILKYILKMILEGIITWAVSSLKAQECESFKLCD